MTRTDRTQRVDPSRADAYAEVGRRLMQAGRVIVEHGDARHATALAILAVHAAIAFADAAAIHAGGRKATAADHTATIRVLRAVFGSRLPAVIDTSLQRVLSEKDRFEYQGYLATMREAASMLKRAGEIGEWVERVLTTERRSAP